MTQKSPNEGQSLSSRKLHLLALLLILVLIGGNWISENPNSERSAANSFSATRAISQLGTIVGEPRAHPTGSLQNAEELNKIEQAVRGLGYRSERQSAYLCNDLNECMQLHNLIVRIPGQTDGPAVLVDAHYDSVAAGPGVADNGSGVAIALEIARQIHLGPHLKYPVVLLFDDAEEQGLLGSQAFVNSPYARDVAWAVNLDARGVRGPSLMYQTSKNNSALMQLYQRTTQRPVSNSLMAAFYEHLPSDTDFTNLSAHGIQGFNLAFLGGTGFYHRTGDTFANLDLKSVQHQGEEALALTRALATDPPPLRAEGSAVYFDLFRHEFIWPRWLCLALLVVGLALLGFATLYRAHTSDAVAFVRGAATLVLTLLLSGVCGCALLWALYPNALSIPELPAHPAPAILAFAALGFAVAGLVFSLVPVRGSLREYLVGYWTTVTLASAGLFVVLFGASYITIAPALVAAFSLAAAVCWGIHKPGPAALAVFGSVLAAGVLWIPLLRLLYLGEGALALPVINCVVAAVLLLVLPSLWPAKVPLQRAAIGASAIAALAAIVAAFVPLYGPAAPFGFNLFCIQEDAGPPRWVLPMPKKYLPLVSDLMRTANFTLDPHPETLRPFASTADVYTAAAATPSLATVELRLLGRTASPAALCYDTLLTAPSQVDRIVLWFPPTTLVKALTLNGQALSPATGAGWKRFSSTGMEEGLKANFCFDLKGGTDLYLDALEYGLPPAGSALMRARGSGASESQDGDITHHYQRVRMEPPLK